MSILTSAQTVDIGHGRGRLAPVPAASIARIDAELARLGLAQYADINSAWRDPRVQQDLYDDYQAYLRGGTWAPLALPPDKSVHCKGEAADSDDWYHAAKAAVWRAGGWRQTARYPGTTKDEPWHGEHFPHLDELATRPAGGGATPFPIPEEDDMPIFQKFIDKRPRELPKGGWHNVYLNDKNHTSFASGRCIVQSTVVVQLSGPPVGSEIQFRLVTTKAGTNDVRGGTTAREAVITPGMTYATVSDAIELTNPDDGVRWQMVVQHEGVTIHRTEISAVIHPVR